MADDRVCDVQDGLAGAVVLFEGDRARVGVVALERQDVAHVGASKSVHGVVRHQPVGDEVVCPFDVQVIDGVLPGPPLHCLDDVVATTLVDHHHSRADGGGRSELE